ncbi:TPA: DMT family transporter [Citrobacter koseri]|nr:DMT family transporter [Citrobacter koseri]HEM7934603.1 DMT family transporter [Citrobacter koseri]
MLLKIIFAMTAFAANSVLCRVALKGGHIDVSTFSGIRLLSGAVLLYFFLQLRKTHTRPEYNWLNALFLCVYVFTFSIAYVSLNTATGALLLFGAVQIVMTGWGLYKGEKLSPAKGAGILAAVAGICLLLLPGAEAPPMNAAALMVVSGIAWGFYSLRGKQAKNAAAATTGNFILAIPLSLIATFAIDVHPQTDTVGLLLAVIAGAITSGAAYLIWYSIVPSLSSTTASTLQLSVPCLAAIGGVMFLGESMSLRVLFSTAIIMSGIGLVIYSDKKRIKN